MRFVLLAALPVISLLGCSASHPPDHCDEPWRVDFDRRACADSVDEESDPSSGDDDGGVGRPRRDAGPRATRAEAGFDPELDGDGPCQVGSTRKCQCASGAYRDQSCQLDRSWAACTCDGRPPLVFGDAAVPRDGGRRDSSTADPTDASEGARDAAVERDASVEVLGPPLTYVPATPIGAVPDCRAPLPAAKPARTARWLAFRAASRSGTGATLQLVTLGEAGPGLPVEAGGIDPSGALGGWSSDGAHFAFSARAVRDGAGSVQLASVPADGASTPPTLATAATRAGFASWAPGLPRLSVRTSDPLASQVVVFDTTAPIRQLAALPLGAHSFERTYWSPDSRYLGLSASDMTGLSFWDLDAPSSSATTIDTGARSLSWSTDGKRFAYVRAGRASALWAVAWNGSVQSKQLVSDNVHTLGVSVNEPLWLDADRLFWQEAGGELFVTDLRGETPVTTPVGLQPPYYSVSPGGVCIAYAGPCSGDGALGVCVRKLDPGGTPLPVHVSNLPWGGVVWSQTADQLALSSPAGTVVEALNLDAQVFAPQLLALGREGQHVRADMAWAPGAPARWLAFHVPGERPAQKSLSLWSVTSKKHSRSSSATCRRWALPGRPMRATWCCRASPQEGHRPRPRGCSSSA